MVLLRGGSRTAPRVNAARASVARGSCSSDPRIPIPYTNQQSTVTLSRADDNDGITTAMF